MFAIMKKEDIPQKEPVNPPSIEEVKDEITETIVELKTIAAPIWWVGKQLGCSEIDCVTKSEGILRTKKDDAVSKNAANSIGLKASQIADVHLNGRSR